MKFLKVHWLLVLALLLLALMSAPMLYFGSLLNTLERQSRASGYFHSPRPAQIGVCLDNLAESRWFHEKNFWEKEAGTRKLSLEIRIAHHSLKRQIRQIKGFIHQQVRVLIVVPVSRSGLGDVLKEAAQKGIKIILYDELTDGPADFYCGIDYEAMGKRQGASLFDRAGPGNYLQIRGPVTSYKAEWLANGQMAGLKSRSSHATRFLAVTLPDWSPDQAVVKARTYMLHQDLTAILTPNDLIAEAIRQFYHEQKRPLPFLAGLGAEVALRRRLQAREPILTWQFDYLSLAQTALTVAQQFCDGEEPEASAVLVHQNRKMPAYWLRGSLVTPPSPEVIVPVGASGTKNFASRIFIVTK